VLFPVALSFTRPVVCVYYRSPQKNNCKKEKLQSGKKESLPRGVTKEPLQKREIAKGRLNLLRV